VHPLIDETLTPDMTISTGLDLHSCPLFTVAPVKLTVPKLVSGRTPLVELGASAMTSAELRAAPPAAWLAVWVHFCVLSVSVITKSPAE